MRTIRRAFARTYKHTFHSIRMLNTSLFLSLSFHLRRNETEKSFSKKSSLGVYVSFVFGFAVADVVVVHLLVHVIVNDYSVC